MFDIEVLKEMKLSELQEIAKIAKVKKYRTLKKDELIYQILDVQYYFLYSMEKRFR